MSRNNYVSDITKDYEINRLPDSYFPTKQVKKGFLKWKKTVEVANQRKLRHARGVLTRELLEGISEVFGEKVTVKGIEGEQYGEVMDTAAKNGIWDFFITNSESDESIGKITYHNKNMKQYVNWCYDLNLVVFEDAIKTPEQFNSLQTKLPSHPRHPYTPKNAFFQKDSYYEE